VALEEALNLMKQGDAVLLTVQDLNSSLICAPNQVAAEKMEAIKERTRGSRNFGNQPREHYFRRFSSMKKRRINQSDSKFSQD